MELVNGDEDCDDGCGSIVVSFSFNQTTLYRIQANENLCE